MPAMCILLWLLPKDTKSFLCLDSLKFTLKKIIKHYPIVLYTPLKKFYYFPIFQANRNLKVLHMLRY